MKQRKMNEQTKKRKVCERSSKMEKKTDLGVRATQSKGAGEAE